MCVSVCEILQCLTALEAVTKRKQFVFQRSYWEETGKAPQNGLSQSLFMNTFTDIIKMLQLAILNGFRFLFYTYLFL